MRLDPGEVEALALKLRNLHRVTLESLSEGLAIGRLAAEDYSRAKQVTFRKVAKLRASCLSSGIRVSATQLPQVHHLVRYAAACFDLDQPQAYLLGGQGPAFAAGTRGNGIIGLSPWLVAAATPQELLHVIGHEIGHLLMEDFQLTVARSAAMARLEEVLERGHEPPPALIQQLERLNAESRLHEHVADRAGLLCCQSLTAAERGMLLAVVGERSVVDRIDIDDYIATQTRGIEFLPPFALAAAETTHPLTPHRLTAMREFAASRYATILERHSIRLSF